MAHGGHDLAGLPELADELLRGGRVDEVEHGAVAADVEDGVEVGGLAEEGVEFLGGFPHGARVAQEVLRDGVVLGGFDRGRVQRGFAARGGGDGYGGFGVEDVVGVGELWRGEGRLGGAMEGRGGGGDVPGRYQPVGLSRLPSLLWEVRTKRILGAIAAISISIAYGRK